MIAKRITSLAKHSTVRLAADFAEVLIYNYIGEGEDEVNPTQLRTQLKEADEKFNLIKLRFHSGGGSVYDGMAMMTTIQGLRALTHGYVDGLAASMAAILLQGCDKRYMAKHSRLMVHQGSGMTYGQSSEHRRTADQLDSINDEFAQILADRTGKEKQFILDNWLAEGKDKWFTAQEALAAGLIDEIVQGEAPPPPSTSSGSSAKMTPQMVAHYDKYLLNNKKTTMDTPQMTLVIDRLNKVEGIKLEATASEVDLFNAINKVVHENETLKGKLKTQKEEAETREATIKAEALVKPAVADGRLTKDEEQDMIDLAVANYDLAEKQIGKMKKPANPFESTGKGGTATEEVTLSATLEAADLTEGERKLAAKGFKAMFKEDTKVLNAWKTGKPEVWKALYKEQYGADASL
ncbi:MAG: ATP-dependent Clp protease proteolytic subunit [Cyclobacteriaceae bacterium]